MGLSFGRSLLSQPDPPPTPATAPTHTQNNIERTAKFGVTLAIANAPERENNKEKRLLHCVLARLVKNIQALSSAGRSDNPKLFSLDVPGFTVPAFLAARLAEWPVALEAGPPPMLTSTSAAVFKPAPAVKSKAPHSAETGGERRPERARPSKSRRVVSPLSAAAAAASASSSYYYSSSSSYSSSASASAAAAAAAGPQFESFESAPFLSLITTEVGPLDEAWSSVVSPFPFSLSISTDEATGRHWGVCSPAGRGAPSLLLDIDDQALDAIMSLSPSMYLLSPPKSAKPQDGHHNGLGLDTILPISPALLLSPPKSATAPQQQQQPQHMGTLAYLAAAAALRV